MDACKVRVMREGVEYQCVTEDSKTRVYLSVVRKADEDKLRKELNARQRYRIKKKIKKWAKVAIKEIAKVMFGAMAGFLVYVKLAEKLRIERGYDAIGGELIFACLVAIAFCYLGDFLLEWKGREVQ